MKTATMSKKMRRIQGSSELSVHGSMQQRDITQQQRAQKRMM
jgi:hypothetical protein